jgi:hypothetical protein
MALMMFVSGSLCGAFLASLRGRQGIKVSAAQMRFLLDGENGWGYAKKIVYLLSRTPILVIPPV